MYQIMYLKITQLQGIYLLTLIPSGDQRSSNYEEFGVNTGHYLFNNI